MFRSTPKQKQKNGVRLRRLQNFSLAGEKRIAAMSPGAGQVYAAMQAYKVACRRRDVCGATMKI